MMRKIIHIDMDAFYASVEQRDDPSLRGKPVAVGGDGRRGVVAAASYEARRFGVRSAMASVTALRRCPELIFVRPRFMAYREISRRILEIFETYTEQVEPLSLDEAYLDVTEACGKTGSAAALAKEVRAKIHSETGLTASAGVSYNKFLAKLACEQRKPDGLFVIPPREGPAFVESLAIERFHGVGPATAAKMRALGVATGGDLKAQPLAFLRERFGKSGDYYYWAARGVDGREVRADRERKSIGAENTFARDIDSLASARAALAPLLEKIWSRRDALGADARTVTLKIKYADFKRATRSMTARRPLRAIAEIERIALDLLIGVFPSRQAIRLLGVALSNFQGAAQSQFEMGF